MKWKHEKNFVFATVENEIAKFVLHSVQSDYQHLLLFWSALSLLCIWRARISRKRTNQKKASTSIQKLYDCVELSVRVCVCVAGQPITNQINRNFVTVLALNKSNWIYSIKNPCTNQWGRIFKEKVEKYFHIFQLDTFPKFQHFRFNFNKTALILR